MSLLFSSVTHLGSSPAMIGLLFALQPYAILIKHKRDRILYYNHITKDIIADAHHTSANYDDTVSEFDKTNLEMNGINIPFVEVPYNCIANI
jgi:hypothetical protein